MTSTPTEAEQAAEQWHDAHADDPGHAEAYSSCWCCCTACDPDYEPAEPNPHFAEAMAAMNASKS